MKTSLQTLLVDFLFCGVSFAQGDARNRAPTYSTFRSLVNQAAGMARVRAGMPVSDWTNRALTDRGKNGDGKLDRSEIPPAVVGRLDTAQDGFVTGDELKILRRNRE